MKTLKELIGNKERVWFYIEEKDRPAFLQFAKDSGCLWMNGDEIKPEEDNIGFHMGINSEHKLGFVSIMVWQLGKDITKIKFKEIEG